MRHRALCLLTASFTCWSLATPSEAFGQRMELVADLAPEPPRSSTFSAPDDLWQFGDQVVLQSPTGLWITDGTTPNTYSMGQGLNSGIFSSTRLGATAERIFWLADRIRGDGPWLWTSDGTPRGVAPMDEMLAIVHQGHPGQHILVGSALYFSAFEGGSFGVWRYVHGDGPPIRLYSGPTSRGDDNVAWFAELDGSIYFLAPDSQQGPGLWSTDGTSAGTHRLATFGLSGQSEPVAITRIGALLFFFADEGSGRELWVSDGTAAGTRPVTRFRDSGGFVVVPWVKGWAGGAFFLARTDQEGDELWTSDGTFEGTRPLTAFEGTGQIWPPNSQDAFAAIDEMILFPSRDGSSDAFTLWKVERSSAGAARIQPGEGAVELSTEEFSLLALDGRAFFVEEREGLRGRLWFTDGTEEGTLPMEALCGPQCGGNVAGFQLLADEVFFATAASSFGELALWRTDGTAAGTESLELGAYSLLASTLESPHWIAKVRDGHLVSAEGPEGDQLLLKVPDGGSARVVVPMTASSRGSGPDAFQPLGNELVFTARTLGNRDLGWKIHAVDPATLRVRDFVEDPPWINSLKPTSIAVAGNRVFFELERVQRELWATDGTPEGSVRVWAGNGSQPLSFQQPIGNELIFGPPGCEIWRSDGTVEGTTRVAEIGLPTCGPRYATVLGDDLYFLTEAGPFGDELQAVRADLTTGESEVLAPAVFTSFLPEPENGPRFTAFGGQVFFIFDSAIWRSEATGGGATRVAQFDRSLATAPMVELGGALYSLIRQDREVVLRRSDGTEEGTSVVRTWPFAPEPATLSLDLAKARGMLWFPMYEESSGLELWRSDGSEDGTVLVEDIEPGRGDSDPRGFTSVGDRLYFSALDRFHGRELWTIDGRAEVPRVVQDLNPGPYSGVGSLRIAFNGSLWLSATEGLRGAELWRLPLDREPGCHPTTDRLCLQDGRFAVEAHWRDFQDRFGSGQAVPLTADTGYFWFFDEENVETILKVLDGRGNNLHFWTFYGALSNVEYFLTVTDTETGSARRYFNPLRNFASVGDTLSFGPRGAGSLAALAGQLEAAPSAEPVVVESFDALQVGEGCVPSSTRLCLQEGRFAVEARWTDFGGNSGAGQAVSLTGDTGYFWFFRDTNVETVLKVLDGRPNNGNFWVFYGALSNVDYDLVITDCETGAVKTYLNRGRTFASVGDTLAFPGA